MRANARFDVVSIKPSERWVGNGGFRRIDVGILVVSGMTVRELISNAYALRNHQIEGGPKWVDAERYDLAAKDTSAGKFDSNSMTKQQFAAVVAADYEKLRALLADRFQLKVHTEKRELPAYALTVAKAEKLHGAPCGGGYRLEEDFAKGPMRIESLAAVFSHDMDRPVVDATGLKGCYDIDLQWTLDPDNDEVPSITAALQSLGLKLASTKSRTDVLVIDHVERPSPN